MTLGQIIDTCHITATRISAPQNMFHLLLHKIFIFAATFNLCAKMSIQSKEVYFLWNWDTCSWDAESITNDLPSSSKTFTWTLFSRLVHNNLTSDISILLYFSSTICDNRYILCITIRVSSIYKQPYIFFQKYESNIVVESVI